MSNPNATQEEDTDSPPPPAPQFDAASLSILTQQAQAHAQIQQAQLLSAIHPWSPHHATAAAAANNSLYAMLAHQHQMQLLQQQAALGLFLPSPTHSGANVAALPSSMEPCPSSEVKALQGGNNTGRVNTVASLVASLEKEQSKEEEEQDGQAVSLPSWYTSCRMLGVEEDAEYLNELQCLLRREVVEVFGATKTDVALYGKNNPPAQGQVGIRCKHCKHLSSTKQAPGAVSYPPRISSIYNAVKKMYRLHFDHCECIPSDLREKTAPLKNDNANRSWRKQYWVDSAKRIGLVDGKRGVYFGRDPNGPLSALERLGHAFLMEEEDGPSEEEEEAPTNLELQHDVQEPDYYPLVLPEDKTLISDYLYLALEQMQPTNLLESDRVGCYKGRRVGFPGLACKHCVGQAGCGRYFPASEASLSQTTTSQTLVNHVRNCRRCPIEIREELTLMKRVKDFESKSSDSKPRHGGRKVFFHRLWCRIQRIPLPKNEKIDESPHTKTPNRERSYSTGSSGKKRKKSIDLDEDSARTSNKIDEEEGNDNEMDSVSLNSPLKDYISTAFIGSVRLARGDDSHWLSDACCFVRKELVEAFVAGPEDMYDTNCKSLGQVGIRCVYCAKKPVEDRPKGHSCYPTSIAGVQDAVSDLQRRHLQLCSEIPGSTRAAFRLMKGFEAKTDGDTAQYWMDSAKELGLLDHDGGNGEVIFVRDPHKPSPADEVDEERKNNAPTGSFIVQPEDRAACTDHIILLLKQFTPCRYNHSDRKVGIAKSRDRPIDFPGFQCIHCNHKRYFPIAEKKVSDTTNLMMTHITNCFGAPMDVKASLCYLQHRSLIQKTQLMGNWKITFFKRVWNRLHNQARADGPSYTHQALPTTPATAAAQPADEEELAVELSHDIDTAETFDEEADPSQADELAKMRPLIRAAALWLSEQDANAEARVRSGRGIGTIQTVRQKNGRGRGGRGRGVMGRLGY